VILFSTSAARYPAANFSKLPMGKCRYKLLNYGFIQIVQRVAGESLPIAFLCIP